MFHLIILGLLLYYIYFAWNYPRTRTVLGGLNPEIQLPHEHPVELYHNNMSAASQKVRTCLAEAGIEYKAHHLNLPTTGSWETKTPEYLRISPEGTVPVLVHNGHPVYESHEIISYIDEVLTPGGPKLIPSDPEKLAIMTKWQDSCSIIRGDIMADLRTAMYNRAGNCLVSITTPAFAALNHHFVTWFQVFYSVLMIPLLKNKQLAVLTIMFKIFGVKALYLVPMLKKASTNALPALLHHLGLLEEELEKGGGPWICGDKFTLADISWVPILERMEITTFWDSVDRACFPKVWQYWESIQARPSFKEANLLAQKESEKYQMIKKTIQHWKKEHLWLRENVFSVKE